MNAALRATLWSGLLLAAGGVRWWRAGTMPDNPAERLPLLDLPLDHPPLLHLVTGLLAPEQRVLVSLVAGVAAVFFVGLLARRALGDVAALVALAVAAVSPPMVFLGSWWSQESLTIAIAAGTAWLLVQVLDEGTTRRRRAGLAACGLLLSSSSWVGLAPLLAWAAWLGVFAPWWLEPDRARSAALALGAAVAVTLVGYAGLMMSGSDPQGALGWARLPRGLAAVQGHLDSIAALLLGRVGRFPPVSRVVLAGITLTLMVLGWRRTAPDGQGSAWASVLAVGALGGLLVALFVHPWIPVAVEKALWFATPMVVCLVLAALWPSAARGVRPPTSVALLGLFALSLGGCVDTDEDGVWDRQDCAPEDPGVYPGAPEVWGDLVDNDCDEVVDDSPDYLFLAEDEPNDTLLAGCFAPEGQPLGNIAAFGLLNRVSGRIETVVDDSYDEGDLDCYQIRFPDDAGRPRLEVNLSWDDPESDLDFAVQGLWEGEQAGFALADTPGPGPEIRVTSSGFDGGASLWVWVVGYSGPPTDYTLDLVLR